MKQFLFLLLFLAGNLFSQNPVLSWAKTFGGPGRQFGYRVAVDNSGNVFTSVQFEDTVDLDPGPSIYTVSGPQYADNFAIVKLDASGNFIWAKYFLGHYQANLRCEGIETDAAGNIYVSGYFKDSVDFDPGPATKFIKATGTSSFILKLRSNGDLSWAQCFVGNSFVEDITLDTKANIFLTGSYINKVDFDPSAATYTLQNLNWDANFFAKLDSSGNFLWVKEFKGTWYSWGQSIVTDTSGNIHVYGGYRFQVDFDPGPGTHTLYTSDPAQFLAKLDINGNFLFVKTWDSDVISGVAVDAQGNINLGMTTYSGTIDLDPGSGVFTISPTVADFAIVQLDGSGNFNWAKYSGGLAALHSDICCDKLGNIYASGMFAGFIDLDPGAGTFTAQGAPQGTLTGFILNLDPYGNFIWGGITEASGPSISNSSPAVVQYEMTADYYGNIYMAGVHHGYYCNLDPTGGTYTVAGILEGYTSKLSICLLSAITNTSLLTYCTPGSTTLSASSPGTISWYSSPTSTNAIASGTSYTTPVLSAGSYTYYLEANQCKGIYARTPIVVNVSAYPNVQVNSSKPIICLGETTQIQLTGASAYSVNGILSSSGFSFSPVSTVTLQVVGVNPGNCVDSTVFIQQVAICTQIEDDAHIDLSLWPNPASDYFYVDVQKPSVVTLISMSGYKLLEMSISDKQKIDIANIPNGFYLVEISTNDKLTYRRRLVKN